MTDARHLYLGTHVHHTHKNISGVCLCVVPVLAQGLCSLLGLMQRSHATPLLILEQALPLAPPLLILEPALACRSSFFRTSWLFLMFPKLKAGLRGEDGSTPPRSRAVQVAARASRGRGCEGKMARPHLGAARAVQVAARASRGRDCEGMLARPHLASAVLRGDAGSTPPRSRRVRPSGCSS